jgi:uracil-DNA glycosylase
VDHLTDFVGLATEIAGCRLCPRLVDWREHVANVKRASFADHEYWGKGVPGFGDPAARLLVVGLAPAAHGANRTGRMFTGDRSGDWLYRALHVAGFANQPTSVDRHDGLVLTDAWVTSPVRCAPPDNKPLPVERDTCAPYLAREFALLTNKQVIVCLGQYGYLATWRFLADQGHEMPRPRPRFAHGAAIGLGELTIVMSYHPSQQNTFTGRLTELMFDDVFATASARLRA